MSPQPTEVSTSNTSVSFPLARATQRGVRTKRSPVAGPDRELLHNYKLAALTSLRPHRKYTTGSAVPQPFLPPLLTCGNGGNTVAGHHVDAIQFRGDVQMRTANMILSHRRLSKRTGLQDDCDSSFVSVPALSRPSQEAAFHAGRLSPDKPVGCGIPSCLANYRKSHQPI